MIAEFEKLILSALPGAVGGGLVSWIAAPHLANREERGRFRSGACKEIRAIAGAEWLKIRAYQDHALGSMRREADSPKYLDDVILCARLRTLADGLSWWRKRRVTRRLKRLFGSTTLEFCEIYGDAASQADKVTALALMRDINVIKNPDRFRQVDRGSYDRALHYAPDSKQIADLVRHLNKLKACR